MERLSHWEIGMTLAMASPGPDRFVIVQNAGQATQQCIVDVVEQMPVTIQGLRHERSPERYALGS